MNKDYAAFAAGLPHQAIGIKVAEMADMDLAHVQCVDIHCPATAFPTVTITSIVHKSDSDELVETLTRYQLVPIEDRKDADE